MPGLDECVLPMSEVPPPERTIDREAAAALIEPLTDLVVRVGATILAVNREAMEIEGKRDGSPVTDADLAADRLIAETLGQLTPNVPAVSEERIEFAKPPGDLFFLVDPLDGTKEFIAGRPEFTVNIALVANGKPVLGVVGAPGLGLVWRGLVGRGAERLRIKRDTVGAAEPIHTRRLPMLGQPWIAAVSRSHRDARTEAFIKRRPGAVRQKAGSALKFCRVAEGAADIYPRLAPTSQWDVAAGCAILDAAGGKVTDSRGAELEFGRRSDQFIVPEFIAWGDPLAVASY
jgi:3'(2'), 5'-bisphosphate nucleotidase